MPREAVVVVVEGLAVKRLQAMTQLPPMAPLRWLRLQDKRGGAAMGATAITQAQVSRAAMAATVTMGSRAAYTRVEVAVVAAVVAELARPLQRQARAATVAKAARAVTAR